MTRDELVAIVVEVDDAPIDVALFVLGLAAQVEPGLWGDGLIAMSIERLAARIAATPHEHDPGLDARTRSRERMRSTTR